MKKILTLSLPALLLVAASSIGFAQIKELTLNEITADSDNVIWGRIAGSRVFRVDHPIDGPELYYTTITVEGSSLVEDTPITVDITFHGGFINEREGVYNSEAPPADDVKIGNHVVGFYKWGHLGGDVHANGLHAAHGGLYRTVEDLRGGVTVLGRGPGYAVSGNVKLADLSTAVSKIHAETKQPEKR